MARRKAGRRCSRHRKYSCYRSQVFDKNEPLPNDRHFLGESAVSFEISAMPCAPALQGFVFSLCERHFFGYSREGALNDFKGFDDQHRLSGPIQGDVSPTRFRHRFTSLVLMLRAARCDFLSGPDKRGEFGAQGGVVAEPERYGARITAFDRINQVTHSRAGSGDFAEHCQVRQPSLAIIA
jgi:hypothetical protein